MLKKLIPLAVAAVVAAPAAAMVSSASPSTLGRASTTTGCVPGYEPVLDPATFVRAIDNPYFPLPVGTTFVYRGVRDGQTQVDRVFVTSRTKIVEGITATVVRDVAKHGNQKLEKTFDFYAQDREGNVWYLGENTKAYGPNGRVASTEGSWESGVDDAEPGIIMEANPTVPDGYRQECLKGQAEDSAWILSRGGELTVPYGTVQDVLRTMEFSPLEPKVVDKKIYGPGVGIVQEMTVAGGQETSVLVKVLRP